MWAKLCITFTAIHKFVRKWKCPFLYIYYVRIASWRNESYFSISRNSINFTFLNLRYGVRKASLGYFRKLILTLSTSNRIEYCNYCNLFELHKITTHRTFIRCLENPLAFAHSRNNLSIELSCRSLACGRGNPDVRPNGHSTALSLPQGCQLFLSVLTSDLKNK